MKFSLYLKYGRMVLEGFNREKALFKLSKRSLQCLELKMMGWWKPRLIKGKTLGKPDLQLDVQLEGTVLITPKMQSHKVNKAEL